MTDQTVPPAVCRGCGMILKGKAYHLGGSAYHPRTDDRCKTNHYGGFVCSSECDYRASLRQHQDMPGCGSAKTLDCYARASHRANWPEQYQ